MITSADFKTSIVDEYVSKYAGMPSLALARKIYAENKTAFTTIDAVRSAVRYRRGAHGKRPYSADARFDKYKTPPSRFNASNPLNLPTSD